MVPLFPFQTLGLIRHLSTRWDIQDFEKSIPDPVGQTKQNASNRIRLAHASVSVYGVIDADFRKRRRGKVHRVYLNPRLKPVLTKCYRKGEKDKRRGLSTIYRKVLSQSEGAHEVQVRAAAAAAAVQASRQSAPVQETRKEDDKGT
ncbi:hypothetical protein V1505DRAFT_221896 [Lipomyces doorenjongii]